MLSKIILGPSMQPKYYLGTYNFISIKCNKSTRRADDPTLKLQSMLYTQTTYTRIGLP